MLKKIAIFILSAGVFMSTSIYPPAAEAAAEAGPEAEAAAEVAATTGGASQTEKAAKTGASGGPISGSGGGSVTALPGAVSGQPYLTRLSNGLSVLYLKDQRFPLASLRLYVHAGSTYEKPEEFGLSHLLEHMVFKGTARRPKGKVAADIEAAGGYTNAATSFDYTVYMADMPADEWKIGLDVLQDAAFNPTLDKDELEAEKGVVLEELKRGEDSPGGLLFKLLQNAIFSGTPYSHPIIGYPETIKGITREAMLAYITRHYQPQNMLLVVCGNVEQAELMAEVERLFGKLRNSHESEGLPDVTPQAAVPPEKRVQVEAGPWNNVYLALAFPMPGGDHLESSQFDVLAQLLGGDKTSYFYRKYKYNERLVDDISVSSYGFERSGMLYISASLEASKVAEFWPRLVEDLQRISALRFTPAEFDRARLNLEDSLFRAKETLAGLTSKLGYFQFFGKGELEEENYLQAVRSVDGAALSELAARYIRPDQMAVVALVPQEGKGLVTAQALQATLDKAWPIGPRAPQASAKPDKSAAPEVIELGPGRKVILQADNTLPYIAANLVFTGGNTLLNPDEQGLAALAAATLTKGSARMNATQVEDFLSDRAAELGAAAGNQSFSLGLQTPARFSADLFTLLAETLESPAFAEEEFSRAVQNQLAAIKKREDQAVSLAFRYLFSFLFNNHPYGYLQLGRAEDLPRFKVDDVKKFWEKQKGESWVLSVCGSFNREDILAQAKKLEAALGDPKGALERSRPGTPEWSTSRNQDLKLADRKQAHIFMSFPTVPAMHEDSAGLALLQNVLSGQSGLLFRDLRDEQSLGYSVDAIPWQADQAGLLIFYIGTEAPKVEQAKAGFLKVIKDLAENPLPDAELERGKRQMEGDYYRGRQTLGARSAEAATLSILERPLDSEMARLEKAKTLKPADLQNLARKYLQADKAYWTIVQP